MGRRRPASNDAVDALRSLFMTLPWWACPIIAGIVFMLSAFLLPAVFARSALLASLGIVSRIWAPYLAIVTLLLGISINLRKLSSRRMLDRQTGAVSISALSWREFEHLLAAAFRRQGYGVVETGGRVADGGVDLLLHGKGETVAVQCKHWRSQKVGVQLVRELNGVVHSRTSTADRAIFVTFGDYTQESQAFAKENGIELIDRRKLLQLIGSAKKTGMPLASP